MGVKMQTIIIVRGFFGKSLPSLMRNAQTHTIINRQRHKLICIFTLS